MYVSHIFVHYLLHTYRQIEYLCVYITCFSEEGMDAALFWHPVGSALSPVPGVFVLRHPGLQNSNSVVVFGALAFF